MPYFILSFRPTEDGITNMEAYTDAKVAGEVENPDSCNIAYGSLCPMSLFSYFSDNNDNNLQTNLQSTTYDHYSNLFQRSNAYEDSLE